jgi:hypothetical protein
MIVHYCRQAGIAMWNSMITMVGGWLFAQGPATDPPRLLPGSITRSPNGTVATVSSNSPVVPIDRFKDLGSFAPETMQCVAGIRSGADWLGKIHQPNGRVLPGVNPALAAVGGTDGEAVQALALWGQCTAARVLGDATVTAKANQSLLTLLSGIRPDPADPKRMLPAGTDADRPIFAAAFVLAVAEIPSIDERTAAVAEHMAAFLTTQSALTPRAHALAMRALSTSQRIKPNDWKATSFLRLMQSAQERCDAAMNPILAGGLLSVSTDRAQVFAITDKLLMSQYDRQTVRGGFTWSGAFPVPGDREPTSDQAIVAMGLIQATKLAQQAGDPQRYARYRQALLSSLMFVRGLQATPESAAHFESGFRTRSVVGGVRASVMDGTLRADSTALAITTFSQYVESGLEGRE